MFRSQSWKRFFFEGEWKCKLKPKAMDGFALNYTMERGEMIWWKSTWFFKSFQHHRFLFIFQHTLPEGCLRWSEQTVILWWVVVQIYPNERESESFRQLWKIMVCFSSTKKQAQSGRVDQRKIYRSEAFRVGVGGADEPLVRAWSWLFKIDCNRYTTNWKLGNPNWL